MTKKIDTRKEWEKEFDKRYDHYNPIHDDGSQIPTWNGLDYQGIKDFIQQTIDQEVGKALVKPTK